MVKTVEGSVAIIVGCDCHSMEQWLICVCAKRELCINIWYMCFFKHSV
jgi:hypothetical protein